MSRTDSMIPPKSGATGFVAATAALALAASGLLYWKLAEGSPAPPASSGPAPTIAPAPQGDIVAPPPPPPPVASAPEKAPQKAALAARPARANSAPGGCAGSCTGSAPPELQGALRAKAGAARSCYERALRQNSMLQGRLVVGVRVSPAGRACSVSIVEDGLGDPSVAACVVNLMRSGTLPAPKGGCVDVQIPMSFVGKL